MSSIIESRNNEENSVYLLTADAWIALCKFILRIDQFSFIFIEPWTFDGWEYGGTDD